MKNEQLYNKTVDILVQAYFGDTLVHGNQCGCAVGNIVAANCGFKIHGKGEDMYWKSTGTIWQDAAWYAFIKKYKPEDPNSPYDPNKAAHQIKCTGYTFDELYQIEKAFEQASWGKSNDDWMFNGLMAVIDALDKIHENKDELITESSKKKFNRIVTDERSVATEAK